ncbi:hypothetical protein [Clostridium pasteurianum]|uniref:Uncharacterized protein n=1 Tax=Clostridium pasteurianum BC1 TaxID=86416 RepID=R4KAH2_CLOPA|nr:hypothetical protein [Clostridium pasteurianum]AGK97499.1 hypothetical protein Clopa_2643 [Clostridium pasteurianum BC1]
MYKNKYTTPKTIQDHSMIQPVMPNIEYLFRGEEFEENNINTASPMQQNIVPPTQQNINPPVQQNTVSPVQQMPNVKPVEHQMPNVPTNPSKINKNKIKADAEKIVKIFEQSNPDILNALINCSVSVFAARKYLCKVVEMALMHHHKMNNTKK